MYRTVLIALECDEVRWGSSILDVNSRNMYCRAIERYSGSLASCWRGLLFVVCRKRDPTVLRKTHLVIDSPFTFIALKYAFTVKSALCAISPRPCFSLFASRILSSVIPMLMHTRTTVIFVSHGDACVQIYSNNRIMSEIIILIRAIIQKSYFNRKMSLLSRCFINPDVNNLKWVIFY